jgi:hypothetical protein
MEYRLIIAGGRDFKDYERMKHEVGVFCFDLTQPFPVIISGGQVTKPNTFPERDMPELWYGADWLGLKYAAERELKWKKFPANWNAFGKSAGPLRNEEMAIYSNAAIVFWDGTSKGSADMINKARLHKIELKIVNY